MASAPPHPHPRWLLGAGAVRCRVPVTTVTTVTPDPSPTGAAGPPRARRLPIVTVIVATVGVVVALVGLAWGTRPLATETQDCGTAFSFLLDGEVDIYVNPETPPPGITPAEAAANNARPCQERAADRALPAGGLVLAGTLTAGLAAAVDLGVRGWRWYRLHHLSPVHGGGL